MFGTELTWRLAHKKIQPSREWIWTEARERQMMTSTLQDLAHCSDVGSLESALRTLCAELGTLTRLDILAKNAVGKHRAICFLRLSSEQSEIALMEKLGASRFGNEICLVVDLSVSEPSL